MIAQRSIVSIVILCHFFSKAFVKSFMMAWWMRWKNVLDCGKIRWSHDLEYLCLEGFGLWTQFTAWIQVIWVEALFLCLYKVCLWILTWKMYLSNLLPLWSEERKYHLDNLKIFPVQFSEMEGSYTCEEFYLGPKNSVIPVNEGRDVESQSSASVVLLGCEKNW